VAPLLVPGVAAEICGTGATGGKKPGHLSVTGFSTSANATIPTGGAGEVRRVRECLLRNHEGGGCPSLRVAFRHPRRRDEFGHAANCGRSASVDL